jgi:hypothetical protein
MSDVRHERRFRDFRGTSAYPPRLAVKADIWNRQLRADFVAEVGDYYARGLPRFVDTSSYYAAFGER